MMGGEFIARLRLIRTMGVGPVAWHQLMRRFGSAVDALYALPHSGLRRDKKPLSLVDQASIEDEIGRVSSLGARHIFFDDDDYPLFLRQVDVPPPVLIALGRTEMMQRTSVAIIGARNASAAACRFARQMAHDVAAEGVTIVSGLARGVDAAAHIGALDGQTCAVIGCGHDVVFPPENAALQERLGEQHLILSEYPPGTEALARHFPARNRIIAGSSLATLVVEAAPRSGSLITARQAAEFGRDVLAVPGSPMDPRAQGCNGLIQDGATLVQNAADVMAALRPMDARMGEGRMVFPQGRRGQDDRGRLREQGAEYREGAHWDMEDFEDGFDGGRLAGADPEAKSEDEDLVEAGELGDRISALLSNTAISVDELVRQSGASSAAVQGVILDMELDGKIERHAGARVSLVR
jgi:DNA processing protein